MWGRCVEVHYARTRTHTTHNLAWCKQIIASIVKIEVYRQKLNSKCHQSLNKYEIDLFVQIIFKKQKSTEAAIRIKVKFPQMELKRSISEVTIVHYTNLYTIIYHPLHSVMFFLGKSFNFFFKNNFSLQTKVSAK